MDALPDTPRRGSVISGCLGLLWILFGGCERAATGVICGCTRGCSPPIPTACTSRAHVPVHQVLLHSVTNNLYRCESFLPVGSDRLVQVYVLLGQLVVIHIIFQAVVLGWYQPSAATALWDQPAGTLWIL